MLSQVQTYLECSVGARYDVGILARLNHHFASTRITGKVIVVAKFGIVISHFPGNPGEATKIETDSFPIEGDHSRLA